MNTFAKALLTVAVVCGLGTSSLQANDYYYDGGCNSPCSTSECAPSCNPCASECGLDCGWLSCWMPWIAAGAAIAGMVVIAATNNN